MKWRSVKPNPSEFLWRTSVRGPLQPTQIPSLPGRVAIGGRGLSGVEETPSLRPLACRQTGKKEKSAGFLPQLNYTNDSLKFQKKIPLSVSLEMHTLNPDSNR